MKRRCRECEYGGTGGENADSASRGSPVGFVQGKVAAWTPPRQSIYHPGLKIGASFLVGPTTLDGLEGFGRGGDRGLDFCVAVGGTQEGCLEL